MTLPDIVEDALDGEAVATRVSLGGGDELFVSPERTLVYRAGGVLRDESVAEYSHDVERLTLSEGRRKVSIGFEYAVDEGGSVSVSKGRLEEILEPVLAAVLRTQGATDPEERFRSAFRFSEMTVVVTDERLLKHVGAAVWDGNYDTYHFEDVVDLEYERGEVATGIVLTVDGRKERIKAPNDRLAEFRQELESALFAYHDVSSADELGVEGSPNQDGSGEDDVVGFDRGVDPLDPGTPPGGGVDLDEEGWDDPDLGGVGRADPEPAGRAGAPDTAPDRAPDTAPESDSEAAPDRDPDSETETDRGASSSPEADRPSSRSTSPDPDRAESDTDTDDTDDADEATPRDEESAAETPFTQDLEPAPEPQPDVSEELESLREAVERQNRLLARHQEAIERLVEQLREG